MGSSSSSSLHSAITDKLENKCVAQAAVDFAKKAEYYSNTSDMDKCRASVFQTIRFANGSSDPDAAICAVAQAAAESVDCSWGPTRFTEIIVELAQNLSTVSAQAMVQGNATFTLGENVTRHSQAKRNLYPAFTGLWMKRPPQLPKAELEEVERFCRLDGSRK